jgi:hypothetical protein
MKRTIVRGALLSVLMLPSLASAGPACPDIVGHWRFELACVGDTRVPPFDGITIFGEVIDQQGCVFYGTLNGQRWVGAIDADGVVHSDYAGAKGVGELGARRAGVYTEMTLTYTIQALGPAPATACTGTATRL